MLIDDKKITSTINYKIALVFIAKYSLTKKTLTAKIKDFTGVKTLIKLKVKDNQSFNVDFEVLSGSAKLVAVSKDKKITVLADKTVSKTFESKFEKGFYRIRVIGENASLNLKLSKI